ncbi:uncharacterized protein LOC144543490 isoform X2 [Centroberyx gerrardi]
MTNALSCDSEVKPRSITDDYEFLVSGDITVAERNITMMLQNSTCPKLKHMPPNCTQDNNIVHSIYNMTCKLQDLNVTTPLTNTVLSLLGCNCPVRTQTTAQLIIPMRHPKRKEKRKVKKLCKAKAILTTLTTCFQMLSVKNKSQPDLAN